jgi:hypothetical protein
VFVEIIYAYLCGRGTVGIRYLQLMLGLRLHTTVCAMRFVVCRDQTCPGTCNLKFAGLSLTYGTYLSEKTADMVSTLFA